MHPRRWPSTITGWIWTALPHASATPARWQSCSTANTRVQTISCACGGLRSWWSPPQRLLDQPDLLLHLEAFDRQSDDLLRSLARSLEGLLAIDSAASTAGLSVDRLRASLHNLFGVLFDVERTRGKIDEWFSMVDDARIAKAAQALACVLRKDRIPQRERRRVRIAAGRREHGQPHARGVAPPPRAA